MERHLRVIGGLAAKMSRIFSSHMRGTVKQTHSIIFLNDGRLMCLRFTRWAWWQWLGISSGASQAFMGRRIVSRRGATKILGWDVNLPPRSPGGDASSCPVGMELQHPDVVSRMHAVAWDMMASLAIQSLCQSAPLGHRMNYPSDLKYKLCPNVMVRHLDPFFSACSLSESRVTSLQL